MTNGGDEAPATRIELPPCYSARVSIGGNGLRQLVVPGGEAELARRDDRLLVHTEAGPLYPISRSRSATGTGLSLLVPTSINLDTGTRIEEAAACTWLHRPSPKSKADVLRTYENSFSFREEDRDRDIQGLRSPQLGAVHSVLGHWIAAPAVPATVVMPTGTGKTEVMLALLAAARPEMLLVLVPSDALRDQLTSKFESFGVLQDFGVVRRSAQRPIVGQIKRGFREVTHAEEFAKACNVIVATPQALNASTAEARLALLNASTHMFIDEAHHVPAETWRQLRDEFGKKPIVQMTATPFREDGKSLGGRQIYAFPLGEAQRQGYFSKIRYISVVDFADQERAVAERAVKQLREDLEAGLDHLLMARVRRIGRAEEILSVYQDLAPDLAPVIVHSAGSPTARRAALDAIRKRDSRAIVCVDMLGEGFDLPSLKVAAIHDPHKSLGVTLQFVGRFARVAGSDIGEATVVVGRPDLRYDDRLRRLYSEDADWNEIVQDLSEGSVEQQQELSEFEAAFGSVPEDVPLRTILPKMSAVVYRTQVDDWKPLGVHEVYPEEDLLTVPIGINEKDRVAWFVTEIRSPLRWGGLETVEEVAYQLFVLYWDQTRQLLYINSSDNSSLHETLAKAVGGSDAERIKGEVIYRTMAQVNRLVPTNVGVLDVRNRARRFSMHVGADVSEGFPIAEAQTKTKTNIFAYGYEDGERVSIGGALKGRIWSYRVADNLKEWVDWCDHVGSKLIDDTITVDEVLRNFIRPSVVEERPALVPLLLEWPWEMFRSTTEEVRISLNDSEWPLVDADLRITDFSRAGPIPFTVLTQDWEAQYVLELAGGDMTFRAKGVEAEIVTRFQRTPFSEYLHKHGVTVLFEQDAVVVPPGFMLKPQRDLPPYDADKLRILDWDAIDITKEAQGAEKAQDSVQARAIVEVLSEGDWDILIDDDGTGEMADIVAMQLQDGRLSVRLVHCKASGEAKPGARLNDLYEVCGQAQKSAQWRRNPPLFFQHLIRREKHRWDRHGRSGIEKGDAATLYRLEEQARLSVVDFNISIAQPGVSKAGISAAQLELLASCETYLHETVHAGFGLLCSA